MKKIGALFVVLTLAACENSAPTDTADSLVANPERLSEVQRLCKEDPQKIGNVPIPKVIQVNGPDAS
jgi:hypothetical protein